MHTSSHRWFWDCLCQDRPEVQPVQSADSTGFCSCIAVAWQQRLSQGPTAAAATAGDCIALSCIPSSMMWLLLLLLLLAVQLLLPVLQLVAHDRLAVRRRAVNHHQHKALLTAAAVPAGSRVWLLVVLPAPTPICLLAAVAAFAHPACRVFLVPQQPGPAVAVTVLGAARGVLVAAAAVACGWHIVGDLGCLCWDGGGHCCCNHCEGASCPTAAASKQRAPLSSLRKARAHSWKAVCSAAGRGCRLARRSCCGSVTA